VARPSVDEEALKLRAALAAASAERRERWIVLGLQLALLAAFLGLWEYASSRWVQRLFVSTPGLIAAAFLRILRSGELWHHVRYTIFETLAGYGLGVSLGLAAALGVSLARNAEPITRPFLIVLYAVPKVAVAPLIILWFGLGLLPKILLAALFVFFVVFLNTVAGMRAASPQLIGVAAVLGASPGATMRKVVLPNAAPYVLAALRLTIPSAMIGAVLGEFISSNRGLGYLVAAASSQYDTSTVFAAIFSLLAVVLALNAAVGALDRRWLRWRQAAGGFSALGGLR
jgi:NitT/TauT family transport system permease protein